MARYVSYGVVAATSLSLGVGALLVLVDARVEGVAEELFEVVTTMLAVVVLTWVIVWLSGRRAAAGVETRLHLANSAGRRWAVLLAAFLAVGREGLETVLFISAAVIMSDRLPALVGASLGLATAVVLGVGLYLASIRLDLRRFFSLTSLVLVLFAAGLLAHAVHGLIELGWIPAGSGPVWDLGADLPAEGVLGQVAGALFGYDPAPALAQVIAHLSYLMVMGGLLATRLRGRMGEQETAPAA